MSNNGPTFTKATYAGKRERTAPPSPGRIEAALEIDKFETGRSRAVHQRINKLGIVEYMKGKKSKAASPGGLFVFGTMVSSSDALPALQGFRPILSEWRTPAEKRHTQP